MCISSTEGYIPTLFCFWLAVKTARIFVIRGHLRVMTKLRLMVGWRTMFDV